jgi:hypothetical protein
MAENTMNQTQLWNELHGLFDTDDGSLPEIELTNLNGQQIGSIFLYLLSSGINVTRDGGTFWDNELNQTRSIRSVENAAILVTECRASPFNIVISGIKIGGIAIPDLGVFIFQKMISLDYRMGWEWGPTQLMGLLDTSSNQANGSRITDNFARW